MPYAPLPHWTNRAVPNEPSETGMPVFRPFHILAAGIVLVIVRLIISSITQECAWETRKKALFWQLSTPGPRSQASLQADPLLLRLGNLTLCFSCIYLALSTKRFIFFLDLTFRPFNLCIYILKIVLIWIFCVRDCPRNHVSVTSENTLHLPILFKIATFLWNESQMITRMF